MKYQDFVADAQGATDYTVEVFAVNQKMVIATSDGAVYITKEQAMNFFGLVDNHKDPLFIQLLELGRV